MCVQEWYGCGGQRIYIVSCLLLLLIMNEVLRALSECVCCFEDGIDCKENVEWIMDSVVVVVVVV